MGLLNILGGAASIVGLVVTCFAMKFAQSAAQAARDARKAIRHSNATEVIAKLADTASELQASVENEHSVEGVIRARDLIAGISGFKTRYGRFLDVESKVRLDEAREHVSVISRVLATRGVPEGREKSRILHICHRDVVSVLGEESARIVAALEKEDENG